MTTPSLSLGSVFLTHFPTHDPGGHEQEGPRPAVVVGLPSRAGRPRYPVLWLSPVTTYRRQAWVKAAPELYPILPAGVSHLSADSVVLVDQTRALDASRLARFLGNLTEEQYAPIHDAVRRITER